MSDQPEVDPSFVPLPESANTTPPATPAPTETNAVENIVLSVEVPSHVEEIIETVSPRSSSPQSVQSAHSPCERAPSPASVATPVVPSIPVLCQPVKVGELDELTESFKLDRVTRTREENREYVVFAKGTMRLKVVYFKSGDSWNLSVDGHLFALTDLIRAHVRNNGPNESTLCVTVQDHLYEIALDVSTEVVAHFLMDVGTKWYTFRKEMIGERLTIADCVCPPIPSSSCCKTPTLAQRFRQLFRRA